MWSCASKLNIAGGFVPASLNIPLPAVCAALACLPRAYRDRITDLLIALADDEDGDTDSEEGEPLEADGSAEPDDAG